MYKENFAQKLKKARSDSGFTQEEVAKEIKINRVSLANYEAGRTEPDIETLGKLINFYDITADWLLSTGKQKRSSHSHSSGQLDFTLDNLLYITYNNYTTNYKSKISTFCVSCPYSTADTFLYFAISSNSVPNIIVSSGSSKQTSSCGSNKFRLTQ